MGSLTPISAGAISGAASTPGKFRRVPTIPAQGVDEVRGNRAQALGEVSEGSGAGPAESSRCGFAGFFSSAPRLPELHFRHPSIFVHYLRRNYPRKVPTQKVPVQMILTSRRVAKTWEPLLGHFLLGNFGLY